MGPHGVPWGPMGSHGVPWGPMGSPWLPWKIQECRTSWILMKTTIRQDRKLETRGPNRSAILLFRFILSRQNPLNRHMDNFWTTFAENPVFQFFGPPIPYRAPIESLCDFFDPSPPSPVRPFHRGVAPPQGPVFVTSNFKVKYSKTRN